VGKYCYVASAQRPAREALGRPRGRRGAGAYCVATSTACCTCKRNKWRWRCYPCVWVGALCRRYRSVSGVGWTFSCRWWVSRIDPQCHRWPGHRRRRSIVSSVVALLALTETDSRCRSRCSSPSAAYCQHYLSYARLQVGPRCRSRSAVRRRAVKLARRLLLPVWLSRRCNRRRRRRRTSAANRRQHAGLHYRLVWRCYSSTLWHRQLSSGQHLSMLHGCHRL